LNNNMFSKAAVWLVIALVLFTVFKQFFKTVAARKPKASRDKSSETFILGKHLKRPG